MMVIVGLLLIPLIIVIMKLYWSFNSSKKKRILLQISMLVIAFSYIACTFISHMEPFNFKISSVEDYFIYTMVILVCSPCLWFVIFFYGMLVYRKLRICKNMKLKTDKEYRYYRETLNQIAPSIVMFTYKMSTDIRKSISATILKLKLNGYITEVDNHLQCTNKKDAGLTESEKLLLNSVRTHSFDEKEYARLVEKETLDNKYLKKNNGYIVLKLFKMIATIILPILLINGSIEFDKYCFKNYGVEVMDNVQYVRIENEKDVDYLYNHEIKNKDDYYHEYRKSQDYWSYNYRLVRADKFEYSIVRKTMLFQILDAVYIMLSIISIFVFLILLIEQIRYFNKNYKRTMKGNELVNKAYALKNYLQEYSLIKNRTAEELILWEYYLIYAVVLDVNVGIEDEIIDKYSKIVCVEWVI